MRMRMRMRMRMKIKMRRGMIELASKSRPFKKSARKKIKINGHGEDFFPTLEDIGDTKSTGAQSFITCVNLEWQNDPIYV
jgi:hypothetical protein